jgi:hypothetical protein
MMKWIAPLAIVGVLVLGVVGLLGMYITYSNQEVELSTQFGAQTKANSVIYDKVWKTLQQKAGVADQSADKFKEIYASIMDSRYDGKDQVLMNWIQESNPNFDMSIYKDLSLSIEANRAEFANVQNKLIDIKREHQNLRLKIPSSIFLAIKGTKELELNIVTSSRTENAFQTGKNDDIGLFEKKQISSAPVQQNTPKVVSTANVEALKKIPVMMVPASPATSK